MKAEANNIVVRGIGWAAGQAWGGVLGLPRQSGVEAGGLPLWKKEDCFAYPVKNIGRCDAVTRMTLCACALALKDASISYSEGKKTDMALIGTNEKGSLEANGAYFGDYLQAGRSMGRGNLFIYTLPSSSLAEAAIHFGFQGPMLYMSFPDHGLGAFLEAGAGLLVDGAAEGVLAVKADERDAMAFVLGRPAGSRGVAWRRVADAAAKCGPVDGWISELVSRLEKATEGNCSV
jgi:3-oxoacyl-[acyl-carrier-protein] synthase II